MYKKKEGKERNDAFCVQNIVDLLTLNELYVMFLTKGKVMLERKNAWQRNDSNHLRGLQMDQKGAREERKYVILTEVRPSSTH